MRPATHLADSKLSIFESVRYKSERYHLSPGIQKGVLCGYNV